MNASTVEGLITTTGLAFINPPIISVALPVKAMKVLQYPHTGSQSIPVLTYTGRYTFTLTFTPMDNLINLTCMSGTLGGSWSTRREPT